MGCNTSKESIQQAVEETKEDVKQAAKDFARDLIGDERKSEGSKKSGEARKSSGAETGSANLAGKGSKGEATVEENPPERYKEEREAGSADSGEGNSVEKAATRIQAAFRGHRVRQSMKNTGSSGKQEQNTEPEPTKEQLEQEFREDDKELCHAATKIQATFRGHMSRKVDQAATAAKELVESAAEKIEEKMATAASELEGIDLSDPDLHKAATKIQASFRGHKVRQEVVIPNVDEKK